MSAESTMNTVILAINAMASLATQMTNVSSIIAKAHAEGRNHLSDDELAAVMLIDSNARAVLVAGIAAAE